MMRYKKSIAIVLSFDDDADFFDIAAGVLQRYTLAPYLFLNCRDYILRKSTDINKRKLFRTKKVRRSRYPAKIIIDTEIYSTFCLRCGTRRI